MKKKKLLFTSIIACCTLCSTHTYGQTLDQGLTHYWNFDSNFTSSGTQSGVTLTGHAEGGNIVRSVTGKFGNAINGFFKQGVGDNLITPCNTDATCSFWFYPAQSAGDATNGWSIIGRGVATWASGTNSNNFNGWRLIATSSNQVRLIWFNGQSKSWSNRQILSGGNINIGEWNHIAWKREGSTIKLFVNGAMVSTTTNTTGIINPLPDTWNREFHTGCAYRADANSWYRGFLGEDNASAMDEFGWWNRALTDAEILEFSEGNKPISQYFPSKELKLTVGNGGTVTLQRGTTPETLEKANDSDAFYTVGSGTDPLNFTATPDQPNRYAYWIDKLVSGNNCNIITSALNYSTFPMIAGHIETLFTRYELPNPWIVQFDGDNIRNLYLTSVKVNSTQVISQSTVDPVFGLFKFGSESVVAGKPGETVTLTLHCSNSGDNNFFKGSKGSVYFDANCDGDFIDADELVVANPWIAGTENVNEFNITFTIPATAIPGNSMIRIIATKNTFKLNSPTEEVVRYSYDLPVIISATTLADIIANYETYYAGMTTSDNPGRYSDAKKQEVRNAIDAAITINNGTDEEAKETAKETLKDAINAITVNTLEEDRWYQIKCVHPWASLPYLYINKEDHTIWHGSGTDAPSDNENKYWWKFSSVGGTKMLYNAALKDYAAGWSEGNYMMQPVASAEEASAYTVSANVPYIFHLKTTTREEFHAGLNASKIQSSTTTVTDGGSSWEIIAFTPSMFTNLTTAITAGQAKFDQSTRGDGDNDVNPERYDAYEAALADALLLAADKGAYPEDVEASILALGLNNLDTNLTVDLKETATSLKVIVVDRKITVSGTTSDYTIYNIMGSKVDVNNTLADGVYFVKVDGRQFKVVVR